MHSRITICSINSTYVSMITTIHFTNSNIFIICILITQL